jgi:hypothetical protein
MKRYAGMMCVCLMAMTAFAQKPLPDDLERLSHLEGEAYREARDALIDRGDIRLDDLKAIHADTDQAWRIRLQAGILIEHMERPGEFRDLVERDWFSDPEFDPEWHLSRAGPGEMATTLISKRLQEAGLWYTYFEQFWKGVEVTNPGLRLRPGTWELMILGTVRREAPSEVHELLIAWAVELVSRHPHLDAPFAGNADGILWHFNTRETRLARLERLRRVADTMDHLQLQRMLRHLVWAIEHPEEADVFEAAIDELRRNSAEPWHTLETLEESLQNVRQGRPAKHDVRLWEAEP